MAESKPLIVIPARIGSTRLKDKPLREIGGVPLITHVCRRALEADIGPVILSSDDERVVDCRPQGVKECLGSQFNERCGTDRVAWSIEMYPELDSDYIINLQGDLPFIDPQIIRDLWAKRQESEADIVTARTMPRSYVLGAPAVFRRYNGMEHIGVYAYTAASLKRFASLPQSANEIDQRLEQCRAVDNGMTFDFIFVNHMPLEINTVGDLYHANLIASMLRRSEDTGTGCWGVGGYPRRNEGGDRL